MSKTEIDPKKAILIYACEAGGESFEYMEMIEYEKGVPTKTYPVPEAFFESIAYQFKKEREKSFRYSRFRDAESKSLKILGFHGDEENPVLYFYTPPRGFKLFFSDKKLKNTLYPMPAFVWKAGKHTLDVFAVKDSFENLNKDTEVFHAPLMNMHNGRVCLGSTDWPKSFHEDILSLCSQVVNNFFESKFTHFGGTSNVTNTNYYTLFNELTQKEEYPEEELILYSTLKKQFDGLF